MSDARRCQRILLALGLPIAQDGVPRLTRPTEVRNGWHGRLVRPWGVSEKVVNTLGQADRATRRGR